MKKGKKLELFNNPAKRFAWAFLALNMLGVVMNAVLYYFKIPSGIHTLIDANAFFITINIICYLAFNVMLYFIIKMHFMLSQRKG
ncbi:putative membrane protein [Candidatus Campylobacter infans]|uniref:Putative membrane protein n=1 Tax=Candidatus Campylobacter infans TaxID=2561898 RepID=A0A7H9CMT1_9BACT|nr:putative membrane protein [Candidatus Campylobacter infans]